jgi:hypothetical protein
MLSGDLCDVRKATIAWVQSSLLERFRHDYEFNTLEGPTGSIQITRYGSGDRYDWHMDLGISAMSRRTISGWLSLAESTKAADWKFLLLAI